MEWSFSAGGKWRLREGGGRERFNWAKEWSCEGVVDRGGQGRGGGVLDAGGGVYCGEGGDKWAWDAGTAVWGG